MEQFSFERLNPATTDTDWIADSLFDSTAEKTIPIECDEPWRSVTELAHTEQPVLGLFPAFLNIDMRFHRAVREAGALVFTFPIEQLKIAARVTPILNVGSIVTLERDIESVRSEMAPQTEPAQLRYLSILAPSKKPTLVPEPCITHEIHFAPGLPALTECAVRRETKHVFHPNERFHWRFEEGYGYASDPRGRFGELSLPLQVELSNVCRCGERVSVTLR